MDVAGWAARPDDTERATREGLTATLDRLFPADPVLLPKPRLVARFEEMAPQLQRDVGKMSGDEKLRGQRELQERGRMALQELSVKWLQFAARLRVSIPFPNGTVTPASATMRAMTTSSSTKVKPL